MTDFFRFPHTPHVAWLAEGEPRDDKVLSSEEAASILSGELVLEEKIDGANLGLSVGPDGEIRAQNRGQYLILPYNGQFERLGQWLSLHQDALFDALGEDLMLFGEWCAARHSLDYPALPGWFLGFDVYDRRKQQFWSTKRRDFLLASLGLPAIRRLNAGSFTLEQLKEFVMTGGSQYRDGHMEGLVMRREDEDWLLMRAKLVRPDFTQAIDTHWRKRRIEWNRLHD